jgi:ATP-dependent DNA helicase RecG
MGTYSRGVAQCQPVRRLTPPMPSAARSLIFLSSVQKEFQAERRALKNYIGQDPLLSRFFEIFLFEDTPAAGHAPDQVYLAEVARCAIYVGLFGQDYGWEDAAGVSPTEHEFDHATALGKDRLVFVWGPDAGRHSKMQSLVRKAGDLLVRRRVSTLPELTFALYASLVEHLVRHGLIQSGPFDEGPCPGATFADLDLPALVAFVRRAHSERDFPFSDDTPAPAVLAHLNLLAGDTLARAALLLFGRDPQRFFPAAEIRCMHFHGTTVTRPVPSYQVFKGTLFAQADFATNFVLSVIHRSVGTRAVSNRAPGAYELPPDVIREAIVNALAHRDYAAAAAVQVSVFADRIEVRNPGRLAPPLTPEHLRHPHSSILRNHRVCEALFLARYIEKFGTGTLMMIRESVAHALPEPDFAVTEGEFVTTLWRDWLTERVLAGLGLNERQTQAVAHIKRHGRITNAGYQQTVKTTRKTAARDLDDLVVKGVLQRAGEKRGSHYVLSGKK